MPPDSSLSRQVQVFEPCETGEFSGDLADQPVVTEIQALQVCETPQLRRQNPRQSVGSEIQSHDMAGTADRDAVPLADGRIRGPVVGFLPFGGPPRVS